MKKIGILALALVMAVGGMGAGFAHWAGTLDISGTVEMEDICVGWYTASIEDPRPPAPPANLDYLWDPVAGVPYQGTQDIGWAERTLTDPICVCDVPGWGTTTDTHYKTIVIILHDVYPYYYVDYQVHWHNCGLPVKITNITIDADPQLEVMWTNGFVGEVFVPFKMETCEKIGSSLEVYCKQPTDASTNDGVQPGQTYEFSVTIEYEQWQ